MHASAASQQQFFVQESPVVIGYTSLHEHMRTNIDLKGPLCTAEAFLRLLEPCTTRGTGSLSLSVALLGQQVHSS